MNHVSSEFPSKPPPPAESSQTVRVSTDTERSELNNINRRGVIRNIGKIAATVRSFVAFALPNSGKITELTAAEKEFIRKAADVIFPKDGPIPFSGNEAGVPEYLENLFRNMPEDKRRLMHLLFHFIECSPLAFGPRRTLFTLLKEDEQREVLDFSNKSLYFRRVALQSLRVLMTMGYMANEDVQKAVGWRQDQNPFGLK